MMMSNNASRSLASEVQTMETGTEYWLRRERSANQQLANQRSTDGMCYALHERENRYQR